MDTLLSALRALGDFAIEVLIFFALIFLANSAAYFLLGEDYLILAIVIGTSVTCAAVLFFYPRVSRSWNTRPK